MYEKKIESPFFPKATDNFDRRYCEGEEKIGQETKERYELYINEEEFTQVFKNFTYWNSDELKDKPTPNHIKIERKEYSKSATGGGSVNKQDSSSTRFGESNAFSSSSRQYENQESKLAKSRIKINPSSASSNSIGVNQAAINDLQKSAVMINSNLGGSSILNQLKENNRHHSQIKERKIIGVASSLIFDDKINKNAGRSASFKDPNSAMIVNSNLSNSFLNNFSSTTNQQVLKNNSKEPELSKLPEIESKIEKLKKLNINSISSLGMYTSRSGVSSTINQNNRIINMNNKQQDQSQGGSIILSGIAKKITPTKIITSSSQSKILAGGKQHNYSSLNSNRDIMSNIQYMSHRESSAKK